jgi:hypothetical protein
MSTYADGQIECSESGIVLRWYYPWGSKHIPYGSIRSFERFELTRLTGKLRIWGSGNFTVWANLDTNRPKKDVGFHLDLGRRVTALVTPDDPDTFESVVRSHLPVPTAG